MNPVLLLLAVAGVVAVAAGALGLRRLRADRRWGALVAVDAGRPVTLRSERYRLAGRPDLVRRGPGGVLVPVELKSRPAPARGPFPSHLVQLAAYCLLIEETTGRAPPFGVLRYRDREVVVPYDTTARRRVLEARAGRIARYDGRATPSPAKCAGCPWSPSCDASLSPSR
jgi:CRISPR-associated exonuclease Cas4